VQPGAAIALGEPDSSLEHLHGSYCKDGAKRLTKVHGGRENKSQYEKLEQVAQRDFVTPALAGFKDLPGQSPQKPSLNLVWTLF